jgi:hypothetical protein
MLINTNSGINLYTDVSAVEATANPHRWQLGRSTRRQYWWPLHRQLMCPHDGFDSLDTGGEFANTAVLMYTHNRVMLQYGGSKNLIMDGS